MCQTSDPLIKHLEFEFQDNSTLRPGGGYFWKEKKKYNFIGFFSLSVSSLSQGHQTKKVSFAVYVLEILYMQYTAYSTIKTIIYRKKISHQLRMVDALKYCGFMRNAGF